MINKLIVWPMVKANGQFIEGIFKVHPKCNECEHRACRSLHKKASRGVFEYTCPKKLTCYHGATNKTFVFIGLVNPANKNIPKSFRKDHHRHVSKEMVCSWLEQIQPQHNAIRENSTNDLFSYHNIQPLINILLRETESLVELSLGNDIEQKLNNSNHCLQNIHYTLELVTWMIATRNELINPSIINDKKFQDIQIYPIVDKLVRCFQSLAKTYRIHLYLNGQSHNTRKCTDSLGNMFFILIENALKYSLEYQNVIIKISDKPFNKVLVEIESYGPIVATSEICKIFTDGYRGTHAITHRSSGTGRGLYIAQIIAKRHSSIIKYKQDKSPVEKDGVLMGTNLFSVEI